MSVWAMWVYRDLWLHLDGDLRGCLVAFCLKQEEGVA